MVGFPPPPDKRVTPKNGLWTAPFNRWAYQHMRRLMPTAGWPLAAEPVPLARRPDPAIGEVAVARPDGSTTDLDTFLLETYTDSFVVVRAGEVVHERYYNGMTPMQPHQMMSCTKSFIGLFALAAVARGLVAEQDRVGDLIGELDNGGAFADATLGGVLDMTNSMAFNEDYDDPDAHIHDYAYLAGMGPGTQRTVPARDLYEYLPTLRLDPGRSHGVVFHYQTPNTDVVNWITNRLTDRSVIEDFADLWQQLGTDGEAYMLLDPAGIPIAGGGLNATPNDLARFGAMMAGRGRFAGRQVVGADVLAKLSGGGSPTAFLAGPEAQGFMASGEWTYRAQWWVRRTPGREAIAALGTSGQWIYCDMARNAAVIKQSSQPDPFDITVDEYVLNAIDAVLDAELGIGG